MKKLLFILFLFGFANAQVKRTVDLDTFNTKYVFNGGILSIGGVDEVGTIKYDTSINALMINNGQWGLLDDMWVQYNDTIYTASNPFQIQSNTTTTIPNNASTIINHANGNDLFNSVDTTITPLIIGSRLDLRVNFTISPSVSNTYFIITLDIGGSLGIIMEDSRSLVKVTQPHSYSLSFNGYSLNTFVANGGKIKIWTNNDCDIYDISYIIFEQ